RQVFALPGAVDSDASAGTLKLIREGAVLVRNVDDILEGLDGITVTAELPKATAPAVEMNEIQRQVWDLLAEQPRHLDELAQQLKLGIPQLSGALLTLEMKRAVRRLPGNRYERR